MKAESFFTDKEKERISAAIREVETKTAGEVAVMVVEQSDAYPEGRIIAGLFIGGLLSLLVTDLFWGDSLWVFVLTALIIAVLGGWLINYLPSAKRLFTPNARLELRVRERALTAFYEKGLYKTRDETGVLFFVSLFERKVWVLADKGIYEKIKQETLQEYAGDIAAGIKAGRAAEYLCRDIQKAGEILANHFPVKPDDSNELPDEVIIGRNMG